MRVQQRQRLSFHLGAITFQGAHGTEHHVLQDVQVREEVVGLEDHSDVAAHEVRVDAGIRQLLTEERDPALLDGLEQIRAAQQRRLPRARGADETDHLVTMQLQRYSLKDLILAEALDHRLHVEDDLAHS
jgi:hypothetical protein